MRGGAAISTIEEAPVRNAGSGGYWVRACRLGPAAPAGGSLMT